MNDGNGINYDRNQFCCCRRHRHRRVEVLKPSSSYRVCRDEVGGGSVHGPAWFIVLFYLVGGGGWHVGERVKRSRSIFLSSGGAIVANNMLVRHY